MTGKVKTLLTPSATPEPTSPDPRTHTRTHNGSVVDTGARPAPALRSFKHRRGRITSGQQAALTTLWPRFGVDLPDVPEAGGATDVLDPERVFGRRAGLVLEIGFGMGETTLAMAMADPSRDVLAVDVHTPGAGALVRDLDAAGVTNVRVVVGDALQVLRDLLEPASLDEVRVFFPDPWPKLRHHKRRLVNAAFARRVAQYLHPGGLLHVATDWTPYAEQVLAVVAAEPLLHNGYADEPFGGYAPRPPRPVTRFERQGLAKGHVIHDVIAHRVTDRP